MAFTNHSIIYLNKPIRFPDGWFDIFSGYPTQHDTFADLLTIGVDSTDNYLVVVNKNNIANMIQEVGSGDTAALAALFISADVQGFMALDDHNA